MQFFANDAGGHGVQYAVDLTCQFNPKYKSNGDKCKKVVDKVRYRMNADMLAAGNDERQYYNTPSCHKLPNEQPFWWR